MPVTPTRTDHDRSRNPANTFILPAPGYRIGEEVPFGGFFSPCHTPGLPVSLLGQIVPVVFPALFLREGSADTEAETVALHVGKAIHATLQSFNLARWRGEDSSEATMEEAFSAHFLELEKTEGPVDYADEETRQKVRSCAWNTVKAYMASDEVASQMPLGVEVGLSATIPGLPVPVRGVIDLVQHDLTAVDYKSAAAKPDTGHVAFDHELQLVTYQMMIEEATGDTPPSLDLIYLVKTKTPQVIRVKIPPADDQRKQRITDLYRIAYEGITTERFHPQPGIQCSWCQYRKECSKWNMH